MCAAWESFDSSERGYREQVQMLHLLQQLGHRVVVLDADDLLDNPGTLLFIILFLTVFVVFLWKKYLDRHRIEQVTVAGVGNDPSCRNCAGKNLFGKSVNAET